jgi:hypothetical protein
VELPPSVVSSPWAGAMIDNVTHIRHNGPLRIATPVSKWILGRLSADERE